MENARDIALSDFEFRGTFKEMRVVALSSVFLLKWPPPQLVVSWRLSPPAGGPPPPAHQLISLRV